MRVCARLRWCVCAGAARLTSDTCNRYAKTPHYLCLLKYVIWVMDFGGEPKLTRMRRRQAPLHTTSDGIFYGSDGPVSKLFPL